jgi:hypothetical protein
VIPSFIDIQTLELYKELKDEFDISFKVKNIDFCEVFQKNKSAIIYYNPKNASTECIAHELLHIWLKRYNYNIGNHIFLLTRNNKKLKRILSKFLCDYMENCFDHYKMYPKYAAMGYSDEKFLKDGLKLKASVARIRLLTLKFIGIYSSFAINLYIGYLISILADHIKTNNYTEHISYLRKKDESLYQLVSNFWSKWVVFDIENIDAINNSYMDLTDIFIDELSEWTNNKIII